MDAWDVELITVGGVDERRSLVRDVEREVRVRVRRGVYADARWWAEASPEQRHVLQIRAFTAAADRPPIFSHWLAAVLHGLPSIAPRLARLHVTVADPGVRGNEGVAGHVFSLTREEVVERDGVLFTVPARTVIDVAGAGTMEEGIVVADAALAAGLPKELLHAAIDLAGPRKAAKRTAAVVDFADPGAKSAVESTSRWTMHRIGVEPPILQWRVMDDRGHAGDLDFWFPEARAGGEADGLVKYLDPRFAPRGAAMRVHDEKVREDRVRAQIDRLARWGWAHSRDPRLLGPVLAKVGVRPRRLVVV